MDEFIINEEKICEFYEHLVSEEKAVATIKKYIRDLHFFCNYLSPEKNVNKEIVISYKIYLLEKYSIASVNSMIAALNNFFIFFQKQDLCIKSVKRQKDIFCEKELFLTKNEYKRLLNSAKKGGNKRLYLIMQTICSTGIRIGELRFITKEAVGKGRAQINLKGKVRMVLLPNALRTMLKRYCSEEGINSGCVFVTRNGKAVDRSNIWSEMKKLCISAKVDSRKVYPHNLRHLFARTFYCVTKDLNRLADVLGHSSIETTRIYTKTTLETISMYIERLGLVI